MDCSINFKLHILRIEGILAHYENENSRLFKPDRDFTGNLPARFYFLVVNPNTKTLFSQAVIKNLNALRVFSAVAKKNIKFESVVLNLLDSAKQLDVILLSTQYLMLQFQLKQDAIG